MKPLKGQWLPTLRSEAAWLGGETVGVLSEGPRRAACESYKHLDPTLGNSESVGRGGAPAHVGFSSSPGDSEAQPELTEIDQEQAFRGRHPGRHFTSLCLDR